MDLCFVCIRHPGIHTTWYMVRSAPYIHSTYILPYMLSLILGLFLFYCVLRPHPATCMCIEQQDQWCITSTSDFPRRKFSPKGGTK